jgi:Holliday junction resolvase-like predicted endonuclease
MALLMNWLMLSGAFVLLFVAGWVGIRLNHFWKVLLMKYRFRRGALAEDWARDFLSEQGYSVLGEQKPQKCAILVDDEPHYYTVRIDFVVSKGGRTFGVEVKSGKKAINPSHSDTRRQLLEYSHVYAFDGYFLVDAEAGKLMKIEFPTHPLDRKLRSHWKWWLLLGFSAGVAVSIFVGQM